MNEAPCNGNQEFLIGAGIHDREFGRYAGHWGHGPQTPDSICSEWEGSGLANCGDPGRFEMNDARCAGNTEFLIGAGIHDITGPAADREMIGYVQMLLPQLTGGIHMRLRSRAFIIVSPCNGKRIVFVSADLGMVFQAVKQEVVKRLKAKYNDLYRAENVIISATHTHAGPGGYSHYALYNAISLGFDSQNFEVIVNGIYESIVKAHDNLVEGTISIARGDLGNGNWNRSKEAYLRNPDVGEYSHDTDHAMTLLKLTAADGRPIGTINWYAVHGTSLGNNNRLISGDNKGYASYLFERAMDTDYGAAKTFVAAFAQSNEGDVSPNIPDDPDHKHEFSRLETSAQRQYDCGRLLYDGAQTAIEGGVDYRHVLVDFANVKVDARWTDGQGAQTTCGSAIGAAKLAGTEDGRGVFFLKEGLAKGNVSGVQKVLLRIALALMLFAVKYILRLAPGASRRTRRELSKSMAIVPREEECQGKKPIFLRSGGMKPPWTSQVLPVQLAVIGQLAIVAVPFECTTMAGRRLRIAVEDALREHGIGYCVIAGLANAYAGYLTTPEEYALQHYEGASTEFGPWQLGALQQIAVGLAAWLTGGEPMSSEPEPDIEVSGDFQLELSARSDAAPLFWKLRDPLKDARPSYKPGERVKVAFWGGSPANEFQAQSTFLEVRKQASGGWETIARDWDPETRFVWKRLLLFMPYSLSTVEWHIPSGQEPGTYQIVHHGRARSRSREIKAYSGTSRPFIVV